MGDILWPIVSIVCGLVTLVIGGDVLVRGASLFASAMRISPLVIGLTVVAFGTSAPELGVSLQAAAANAADVAVGNVVGSNIFNVLFVLGMAALVTPLSVSSQLIRLDVPLMILASVALWLTCLDRTISRFEGGLLFTGLIAYITLSIVQSRRETAATQEEFAGELPLPGKFTSSRLVQVGLIVAGLILLGLGSRWLVFGSVAIAKMWNVSELIIGLTIVAVGTSLPEVVTSVVAGMKGERDIAVGNVVGSNLFNILCVLGLTSFVAPGGIPISAAALAFDIPVMVAVAVLCLPIFLTGQTITRWKGALLLFYYVAYTAFILSAQTHPEWSRGLGSILAYVVIPLTLLGIIGSVVAHFRTVALRA